MPDGSAILRIFIHRKKIIPLPFAELYLNIVVYPEIKPQQVVEVPAKLVLFDGRYNAQYPRILEKLIHQHLVIYS